MNSLGTKRCQGFFSYSKCPALPVELKNCICYPRDTNGFTKKNFNQVGPAHWIAKANIYINSIKLYKSMKIEFLPIATRVILFGYCLLSSLIIFQACSSCIIIYTLVCLVYQHALQGNKWFVYNLSFLTEINRNVENWLK